MLPRDLTNEQCDLVHAGSEPLFGPDPVRYYNCMVQLLGAREVASNGEVQSLVAEAQRQINRPARA
jgi:hypothetical protein